MELQAVTGIRRALKLTGLSIALLGALPGGAAAAPTASSNPNAPVLVTSLRTPPRGYRLTAGAVQHIAARAPVVRAELARHPAARPYEDTKGPGRWQVSWFARSRRPVELAQVYVDDATGRVTEAWTGFQVAWTMARGYPGAFGHRVNAWYVWIPLCLLFVAPFAPVVVRRGRPRLTRPSLLHVDLLALLGFSISLALFNHAQIGLSVPLVYPFLLYLLVRMLLLASGRGRPRGPLKPAVPVPWLAVGVVFLVGFRIGLNLVDSNVIDVGYSGVIGANRVLHGQAIYGHWRSDNARGDTYGPVAYYAYLPFVATFGWSGRWDDLPAAHAAAIVFDLLTLLGLFWLGRRIRGPTLGVLLAYAWAAFPFSLWTLSSNTNDALVALLIVAALVAITSPAGRGVLAALAGLTKFAPIALVPLLVRGTGRRPPIRGLVLSAAACLAAVGAALLPVLLQHNLGSLWTDTIAYQSSRQTPFSIWGLWGGLGLEQHLAEGGVAALALVLAILPRRRGIIEVAALSAALIVALQLVANYWLYSYIVWFAPLVLVAALGAYPGAQPDPAVLSEHPERAPAPAQSSRPAAVAMP